MREFGVSLTREEQEDAPDYVRDILRDSKKEHDEVPTIIIEPLSLYQHYCLVTQRFGCFSSLHQENTKVKFEKMIQCKNRVTTHARAHA